MIKKRSIAMGLSMALLCGSMAFASAEVIPADVSVLNDAGRGIYVENLSQEAMDALTETTVIKTADSKTGYLVTFRYHAPDAKRVRIRGEWSFATDRGSFYPMSDNVMPEDYEDGMFPLQVNQKDWPAFDMTKNEETGVWSYTIALPSGTWSYRFIVDGTPGAALTDYSEAFVETDPNNRPIEKELGEQGNSQVRVPFDADRQSVDNSIQLPRSDEKVGTMTYYTYEAVGCDGELKDDPAITVYTPYGYDAQRTEPYKVMYLSHGAGLESETSWVNKGSVSFMMDNLIADYGVEPFVLVVINNYAVNFDVENFINNVVPLVEANYNVATNRENKALAGLSMGGRFTVLNMLDHPKAFGYYGVFSGGFFANMYSAEELNAITFDADALADAHIYLATGSKEFGLPAILNTSERLSKSGVTGYHAQLFDGGHDWNVWRQCFADFFLNELWK